MFQKIDHMKTYLAVLLLMIPSLLLAGDMPKNAHPNIFGTGWDCDRGYYKSGQQCIKVIVPENASIDIYGSGWACNKGYKKSNNSCIPMTREELQKQKELEQAILIEMQRRRLQGVSGDDCDGNGVKS